MLKRYFQKQGGVYMLGDSVVSGNFEDGRLKSIHTLNHGDTEFEADNFILASGSFFSKGLVADQNKIMEPVFGLDVDAAADRGQWYDRNMFNQQPYMSFGVATDSDFRTSRNGSPVENLYAVGAILSGFNPIKEGCGAGVSILTALHVAEHIS
jgi:glycerol-3-phosphate dehydrogenase subunit B